MDFGQLAYLIFWIAILVAAQVAGIYYAYTVGREPRS